MVLPEFEKENLDGMINSYAQNKESLDNYKKVCDEENNWIKEMFSKADIDEYTTISGLTAKVTISKKENFIDNLLITKLKELGALSAIKTVEVVDYDELENLIYNNKLDASQLNDCKTVKEIATIRINKKKGEYCTN